jgi:hypothetical protein
MNTLHNSLFMAFGLWRIRNPLRLARLVGVCRHLRGGILHPMACSSVDGVANDEPAGHEDDGDDRLHLCELMGG